MAQQQPEQDFPVFDDLLDFTTADFQDFDFPLPGDLGFANGQPNGQAAFPPTYYDGLSTIPTVSSSLPPSPPNGGPLAGQRQQSQPTVPSPQQFAHILAAPAQDDAQPGQKRKSAGPNPVELEQQSRVAAEEDKRRRNTAASARFRVKKKQREQALEQTAKEMTDRVHVLEARVGQLEMENKWLKGLITDKNISLEGGPPQFNAEADEGPEAKKRRIAARPAEEETEVA